MKKLNFLIAFVIILFSYLTNAYTKPILFSDPHDSLLFDGAGNQVQNQPLAKGFCNARVVYVSGKATGVVYHKKIEELCGEMDTLVSTSREQLQVGHWLVAGQVIETGPDGILRVELGDGSVIFLDHNTKLTMDINFCMEVTFKMDAGKIWTKVKELMGGKKYAVTGDDAIVGVRGTEFSFQINIEGSDTTNVIKVYEGTVNCQLRAPQVDKNKQKEMEQASQDFQNGKISIEEFGQKMKDFTNEQKDLQEQQKPVDVTVGNKCTATRNTMKVEPIESGDEHWWENVGK
jgi:hypothetical protein